MTKRLSEMLQDAIREVKPAALERLDPLDFADLATALGTALHEAGYAIHASDGRCVRVPGELPGREMTASEARAFQAGVAAAGNRR